MSDLTPSTEAHPVYPGGPDCQPNCPGPWSMYHDGYADGYERGEAEARNPKPIPDAPSLREAALAIQDNAVIPDEYPDHYLVRRDDYAALGNALRPILTADPEAEAERNFSTRSIKG